jgi:DNA invertase Pin-like site-specific DNA recombinase
MKQTRVAIYARVSGNGQNPQMQVKELQAYCRNRGWKIAGEYVDRISGGTDSRPQLNKLMADAHRRRCDVVAVWDFSRFARSPSHLLRALETFSQLGVSFISLREQIDTGTPTGKMVFTILGSVAELERSLIGERVKAGLRNARAHGVKLGRPHCVCSASRKFSSSEGREKRLGRVSRGLPRGMEFRFGRRFICANQGDYEFVIC